MASHAHRSFPAGVSIHNCSRQMSADTTEDEEDPDPSPSGDTVVTWEGETTITCTIGLNGRHSLDRLVIRRPIGLWTLSDKPAQYRERPAAPGR